MLSDDVYITRFRATVASLEAWLQTFGHVAHTEIGRDEASWRMTLTPNVAGACPCELMLRVDQCFDLMVGHELYEDQPIEALEAFQPLLAAIVEGRVVTRTLSTIATGMPVKVQTIVSPDGNSPWTGSWALALPGVTDNPDQLVQRDQHYLPYARGA